MAFLGQTYTADPNNVAGDYTPVPPGDYLVTVESSDKKDAKKPGNAFLELTLVIMDGPERGRKLTDRLNLWNDNQMAVDIAQRSMNALCVAIGKMAISDSAELHNIPIIATVVVDEGKPYIKDGKEVMGKPQNNIRTYKPRDAGMAAAPAQSAAPAAAASGAPAAGGGLPWKQRAA